MSGISSDADEGVIENMRENPFNPPSNYVSTSFTVNREFLMSSPEEFCKALSMASYHAGNWQKPFTPDDLKPFITALNEMIARESHKCTEEANYIHVHQPCDKFGKWVKRGDTFTYKLNKKGRNRARRRGEL